MTNYIIREFTKEDIDVIYELGSNTNDFETAENVVGFCPKSVLKNCVHKNDVLIMVVERPKEIIGFIIANINLSLKKAEIENIFVKKEYRGNGIGSELLKKVIERVKTIGIGNINTLQNVAVDFYIKNGFTKGEEFYWLDLVLNNEFKK